MGLLSILPESFAGVESWITRLFVSRQCDLTLQFGSLIVLLAVLRPCSHRPLGSAAPI